MIKLQLIALFSEKRKLVRLRFQSHVQILFNYNQEPHTNSCRASFVYQFEPHLGKIRCTDSIVKSISYFTKCALGRIMLFTWRSPDEEHLRLIALYLETTKGPGLGPSKECNGTKSALTHWCNQQTTCVDVLPRLLALSASIYTLIQ